MILIPTVGTQWAQRFLVVVAALAAVLVLVSRLRGGIPAGGRPMPVIARLSAVAAVSIAAVMLARAVPPVPGELFAFGRKILIQEDAHAMLYAGEGMNASVAVSEREDGVRSFHVSGKTEATTDPTDMRLQRMLGHLSALLHAKPRTVLVVGFGAGVTAGSFVTYPEIERVVICEIEPLIPRVVSSYFSKENYDVLKDPRVEVIYDDARHFVLTSRKKFDIITTDPIHPWVKGAATLYTREFFELAKRHLNPGGVVTQWVPLYESTLEAVKSEMATFFSVFPDGIAWINDRDGGGDVVLFGQVDPAPIKVKEMEERLDRPENARVAESLRDVDFNSAIELLATYAGRGPDLAAWLKGAAINTDRDLRLQYLAGMGLNVAAAEEITLDLLEARRFPDDLFVASAETLAMLRDAIEKRDPDPDPAEQR
jgi:spermidine synthase